jgi:hypothetical protein
MKRIKLCEITELGYTNEVDVMYDDGTVEMIFRYYTDELSFNEHEFIGLTKDKALELFRLRNKACLRR